MHVSLIQPGRVKTPIWEKSVAAAEELVKDLPPEAQTFYGAEMNRMRDLAKVANDQGVAADEVAKAVEQALVSAKPKTRYVVGSDAKQATFLLKVLPDRWMDYLARRTV